MVYLDDGSIGETIDSDVVQEEIIKFSEDGEDCQVLIRTQALFIQ